jgi:hypothetical protein
MKKIIFLFLILISGCLELYEHKSAIENMNFNALKSNEVLIVFHSKIMQQGTISFLEFANNEVKKTNYSYSINIDSNKFVCSKYEEKIFSLESINDKIDMSSYFTTNKFNIQHKKNEYYKCISDNFLEITNADRKHLLDSLSK